MATNEQHVPVSNSWQAFVCIRFRCHKINFHCFLPSPLPFPTVVLSTKFFVKVHTNETLSTFLTHLYAKKSQTDITRQHSAQLSAFHYYDKL
jgi:hypothetical protein